MSSSGRPTAAVSATEASALARRHRDTRALAEALELRAAVSIATNDGAEARRALAEAAQTWRLANAPLDGFQTHQIEDRWGERNLFTGNVIDGRAQIGDKGKPGYGIALRPEADNIVRCDNSATGGIELSNITCS